MSRARTEAKRTERKQAQDRPRFVCALLALAAFCTLACQSESASKVEVAAGADDCVTCHSDSWAATNAPNHTLASFGQDCASCHDEQQWAPALGFVHTVSFPLSFGHQGPACAACHQAGYARGVTPRECVDCHAARAAQVIDPVHAGLSQNCFACHRTDAFWPARFLHSWPLHGVHALTSCRSCHFEGAAARYEGISSACVSCHAQDRDRANERSPAHRAYGETCNDCHGFDTFGGL